MSHTTHECVVCKVSCPSKHNLDQHMGSRRHRAAVRRASLICSMCNITTRRQADFARHLAGRKHKNKRLLMDIATATFQQMDELYRRAVDILGRSTDAPLDLANCRPNVLASRLKDLGIGHACISCFEEFASEKLVAKHLREIPAHIYRRTFLESEMHEVLQMMEHDPEGAVKVKVVFALKKSLLVHVFH
jgi:hypothetical protein